MGDRNNPIKFGPEWLRNMPRERSAARSTNNSQNSNSGHGTAAAAGSSGANGGAAANTTGSTATATNTTGTSKVLLAKLRYGREEMLALYDRNAEAPPELKGIDTLYQPRGKQPVALNNTFEEDVRDSLRGAPPIGGLSSGDRFGLGRGAGRGTVSDGRGRTRGSYVRAPAAGRGYMPKVGNPRMPYSGGVDDESGLARSWTNNTLNSTNRNSGDQTDWTSKMYRNKRPGTNTNWRQPQSRDEGEEWRSSEPGRSRQLEKWERDWGDRPSGEKSQSWSTNRRTWVGGDSQNEENLPEWAGENAECGGTFDSSGAFHGYSNDDSNLPKQDSAYPLTRSHTHGSFPRSKTVEEGSDEWWASEKAKKLSPKRFDTGDVKFKKQSGIADGGNSTINTNNKSSREDTLQEAHEKRETAAAAEANAEANAAAQAEEKYSNQNLFKSKFTESKTFDALMRSDINVEEASDERGNFQSVIITPNNSLRQKHQHMVLAADGQKHIRLSMQGKSTSDIDHRALKSPEDMLVDNIFGLSMEDEDILSTTLSNSGISNELSTGPIHINKQSMQASGLQSGHPMSGMQPNMMNATGMQMPSGGHMQNTSMPPGAMQSAQHNSMSNSVMASVGLQNPGGMPNSGLQSSGLQATRVQTPGMQPVGITNSALNASLGLPIMPGANIGLPLGMPQQVMPNVCMANNMVASGMRGPASMQAPGNMAMYQSGGDLPGMSASNVGKNSLFLGQNSNNPSMSTANEMPMSNHVSQNNMYPMHGLQHSGSQASFGNSIYSNNQNLTDQWYYEDPERNIQGPFSSKDMYNWYRAGFFTPSLMVRRAFETIMRPLGSYGPVVPFAQLDRMSGFPMSSGFESRPQTGRENMLNTQPSLGLDVDSLWGQPSTSTDLMWRQQPLPRSEPRVNNLPIYFWEQQPSAIASNSLLPEEVTKEMTTEDQILAKLRAAQPVSQPGGMQFMSEPQPPAPPAAAKTEESYPPIQNATPNLEELQKLIQKETLTGNTAVIEPEKDIQAKPEKAAKLDQSSSESSITKQSQNKSSGEAKTTKQSKEIDKSAKNKENNNTKNKTKKAKEEKKEEVEIKTKEEDVIKAEKRSQEPSPSKNKKEEKTKKELEREKKEWIKEGYTIVKGSEKNTNKDSKKKAEEIRAAEEAERKRQEDEKFAAEEEKKKKQAEAAKKQEPQPPQPRVSSESVAKKAPWSAVATQAMQTTRRVGLTLTEIQRLEREKKLEQMKEQQQMMHLIAQQQAAALAREQEMQVGLGWAKKKNNNLNAPGQSLAEIQAEARKQAAAASAAAAAQALEDVQAAAVAPPSLLNHLPWGNTLNGGFWDTQLEQPQKPVKQEAPKVEQIKTKKKPTLIIPSKKEMTPAIEFENWCTGTLASWSSKIDVPTFVGFLKDIESPYEVKDYVKCYLGESKDSNDFSRQFLERRSKLLRVGMVTPSDDLCSPALAVNPRTISGSDYQEVKGKGKKTKKNKMLKVDARILGFSVTASEDRINVGDIDTV